MAVIPSRLAGMGQSAETWLPLIFGAKASPAEQRAAERHQAWRENLAAVRAKAAQEAQMQRGSMQQLQANLGNTMAMMSGTPGETMIPHQVKNPLYAQEMEEWQSENERMTGHHPPGVQPNEIINQERAMTDIDKYRAWDLWNKAHGTNMSGASAFAKALGAGDAPDPWVETPYNALSSQGGLGYPKDQRKGYAEQGSQSIADAIARATDRKYNGLSGTMAEGSDVIAQQYKDNLMQDVWAVATKLAHDSNLIDANTAFHQIMQAMAMGKISPMQIQQTANIDEGALWFADEQELAIQQPSREDRLARLAKEFGYLDDEAATQGVNPIIR